MHARKRRAKSKRRARKLAEQAWDAVDEGNLDLAIRIIRRATEAYPSNPVLWNDQGCLLRQANRIDEAAKAFLSAISLTTNYAEAFANLAEIRFHQGLFREAIKLQKQAVKLDPSFSQFQNTLAAYQATVIEERPSIVEQQALEPDHASNRRELYPEIGNAIDRLEWNELGMQLTNSGWSMIPKLLTASICDSIRDFDNDDSLFAKSVTMNKNRFGRGSYRYFAGRIPSLIDTIRQHFYPHVAAIANDWQDLLKRDRIYPSTWEAFRQECAAAGQTTPSPILLKYPTGGFNALHRDIRGDVYFPIQLVIVLNEGFTGGQFEFCDEPERKKSDRRVIPAKKGDAILFCTSHRLVQIGGAYGLKPINHGMMQVTSGSRSAIGIPFHEYT